MALSKESKQSIKQSIDDLKFKKAPLVQKLKEIMEQKQILENELGIVQSSIDKLQTDLTNG